MGEEREKLNVGRIDIVVPVCDECENVPVLADELRQVAEANGLDIRVIFVDDGSTDGTWAEIERQARADERFEGIRFRRNFGKAAALAAGFDATGAEIIFQMDGDLQDDPAEIPNFLRMLAEGYDLANGWKRRRRDPWHKVWPSKIFNWTVSAVTGLKLHDHNCGFKCFRRRVVKDIKLYGELHRFIPVMAHARGYSVGELPVHHRPRKYGRSKYGVRRFMSGLLDLLTVTFLIGFGQRPLHFVGTVGLVSFLLGALGLAYLALHWLFYQCGVAGFGPIGHRPLLIYALGALLMGFHMLAIGFLAELTIALSAQNTDIYCIAERIESSKGQEAREEGNEKEREGRD
jgi:glycosyltransferase involved in cell wall biosynthesis